MRYSQTCRILAVAIRSGRFGYAVFETPARLLDFGVSRFNSRPAARNRIRTLIRNFRPSIVAVDSGGKGATQRRWRRLISHMIRRQSRGASASVAVISARELRAFFRQYGKTNKYDFATAAAAWFPELTWKLPPKRMFYKPEPWVMTSVDAVLLGAAYLNREKSGGNGVLSPAPRWRS